MADSETTSSGKVLLALDGSPAAATALPIALGLADQLRAVVRVIHVLPTAVTMDLHAPPGVERLENVDILFCKGDVVSRILRETKEPSVELLVLTAHGRQVEPRGRLGRVAEAIIAAATIPILVVQPETASRQTGLSPPIKRLLLPLDGTRETAFVLRPAVALASRFGASLDVLYVASLEQSPREIGQMMAPIYVDQPQHEWEQWASEFLERFCVQCAGCPEDMPLQLYLRQGDVAEQIVGFAAERDYDAIILARRSRLESGRARVLRTVLRQTSCPILLVGSSKTEETT